MIFIKHPFLEPFSPLDIFFHLCSRIKKSSAWYIGRPRGYVGTPAPEMTPKNIVPGNHNDSLKSLEVFYHDVWKVEPTANRLNLNL